MLEGTQVKLGFALSGGGTRGLVHVGALQAFHEHDIRPDIISGTSAGSIVGALYASGYSPAEILEIASERSLMRMFGLRIPAKGFVRHSFLKRILSKYIPENSFENLRLPLLVTIANLNSGMPETKSSGPLIDIVIASSSVPVLFEPIHIDGEIYVDGGLLMNLPASPLVDHSDLIIGVNLIPQLPASSGDLNSIMNIANRCFDLSALNNIKPELAHCDVVIEPPDIQSYSRFNFTQIEKMYEIGYDETVKQIPLIKDKILQANDRMIPAGPSN